MTDFTELDAGDRVRFENTSDHIDQEVVEARITAVFQTSVGTAYRVKPDSEEATLAITPDQIITVADYSTVFEAENWRLVEKENQFFIDPIDTAPFPVTCEELEEAAATAGGRA